MGRVNARQVTDRANSNLITVNCITIDVPISEDLKIISNQTGGDYYSGIQSEKEIDFAFNKIYHKSQENRFLFLHKDSLVILDLYNRKVLTKVNYQADLIKMMSISPDEKSILVTCDNVIAALKMENLLKTSGLGIEEQPDTDITPYFSVISPEPEIVNRITFPKEYMNTSVEKMFNNVITNPGRHTVYIDSIYVESNNSCFSLVSSPEGFAVNSSGQSNIEIRFIPKTTGVNRGKLVIVSGNKKYQCELEGEGMEQGFENLSPQVNFPALKVYSSADTIVPLIKNTGSEPLSINDFRIGPYNQGDFFMKFK